MNRVWTEQYPDGVQSDIDADKYPSLLEIFEQSASKYANQVAFINMGQQISFEELDALSMQFAAYLQESGFKQGDAVAIMLPNLLQYPVTLFGILRAGLTVVNINPLYTERELKHQLIDAQVKMIIIVENFAHTLANIIETTPVKKILVTSIGDMLPMHRRLIVNFAVKYIKKIVPKYNLPNALTFLEAMKIGEKNIYSRPIVNANDIAFLQYTGGTTGVSKGAVLTHRNMVANLEQVADTLKLKVTTGKDLVVTALPLYHIFALTTNCLTFLKFGCPNLLITNPRDMKGFVNELSKYPFAVITGVNTLFNGLLETNGFDDLDFTQFKFGLGGGMAVQRSVAEKWHNVTGTVLLEGYGLTECSPVVSVTPPFITEYSGSIGIPLPSTDIRLVNEEGKEVEQGERGEMHVKGPQVMREYLNQPDETSQVLNDGWLKTGDIAYMDEKGFFFIVDRKKDMILVSGFNVFPNEIEDIAVMHSDITEAAAIGVANEQSGEVVKLFVVKRIQSLTEGDVIAHCRALLTGYKVPKIIEFRDELPKSNVGKILRRELRD